MKFSDSATEIILWLVGIVLFGIYLGVRADGEFGRQQANSAFNQASSLSDLTSESR